LQRSAPPVQSPSSAEELAATLADAEPSLRVQGSGTKSSWAARADPGLLLSTARLDRVLEHNAADLTAVLEAGVPLAQAQQAFREAGQMLALDPPDPGGATIGGVLAAGDSGPLRARYGGPRDLVLGMRIALADGTIVKSGSNVIKNVAGYDLAKLFTGSFGTLGAILSVSVRLHPLPPQTVTALGRTRDAGALARAASVLAHARLEQLGLDVAWAGDGGAVLARFGGAAARAQAQAAHRMLLEAGLDGELVEDDDALWQAQRDGQRSSAGLVARVSGVQTDLEELVRVAEGHGAGLVGRAGLGLCWLRLDEGDADALIAELRARYLMVVLDHPGDLTADRVPEPQQGVAALAGRVKQLFDPDGKLV
jgi:glycolate oxidase FAD binding subunit